MPKGKPKPMKSNLMDFDVQSWCLIKPKLAEILKPKAVIYCRVSEWKQVREGFWLEGQ